MPRELAFGFKTKSGEVFVYVFDPKDPKLQTKMCFNLLKKVNEGLLNREEADYAYASFMVTVQTYLGKFPTESL